jgi:hypothetical protein
MLEVVGHAVGTPQVKADPARKARARHATIAPASEIEGELETFDASAGPGGRVRSGDLRRRETADDVGVRRRSQHDATRHECPLRAVLRRKGMSRVRAACHVAVRSERSWRVTAL